MTRLPRPRWPRVAAVLAAAVLVVPAAACGDDDEDGDGAGGAAAETAATVCGLLRGWSNELAESLNDTSQAITDADDPTTANQTLLDGWDALIAIAEDHTTEAEQLQLPDTDARDELVSDLTEGAERAVSELEQERVGIAALPPITIEAQGGALGGAFTSLEKADSVVEPAIGGYDDAEIRAAFADEPDCRHVIQPF
jgi:hypothetical protein